MRELEFRSFIDGEMVILPFAALQYFDFEGSYVLSFAVDGYDGFWGHEYYDDATKRKCKSAPIMQYTGVKDKNKKKIWEGDIYMAKRSYMPSRGYKKKGYPEKITVICVVEWSVYDAGWSCKEIAPIKEHIEFEKNALYHYYQTSLMGAVDGKADWIEVIGNIYENPELIAQA